MKAIKWKIPVYYKNKTQKIEGETEDSEKAHKRLRKRGQHQKHRSALRALKNGESKIITFSLCAIL